MDSGHSPFAACSEGKLNSILCTSVATVTVNFTSGGKIKILITRGSTLKKAVGYFIGASLEIIEDLGILMP